MLDIVIAKVLLRKQSRNIFTFFPKSSKEGVTVEASLRVYIGALVEQQPDDLCVTAV
jgi:hypothetical protein